MVSVSDSFYFISFWGTSWSKTHNYNVFIFTTKTNEQTKNLTQALVIFRLSGFNETKETWMYFCPWINLSLVNNLSLPAKNKHFFKTPAVLPLPIDYNVLLLFTNALTFPKSLTEFTRWRCCHANVTFYVLFGCVCLFPIQPSNCKTIVLLIHVGGFLSSSFDLFTAPELINMVKHQPRSPYRGFNAMTVCSQATLSRPNYA